MIGRLCLTKIKRKRKHLIRDLEKVPMNTEKDCIYASMVVEMYGKLVTEIHMRHKYYEYNIFTTFLRE